MTYPNSCVTVGDDSHTRVMGGTVASIRLRSLWRARGSASDTTKTPCSPVGDSGLTAGHQPETA